MGAHPSGSRSNPRGKQERSPRRVAERVGRSFYSVVDQRDLDGLKRYKGGLKVEVQVSELDNSIHCCITNSYLKYRVWIDFCFRGIWRNRKGRDATVA